MRNGGTATDDRGPANGDDAWEERSRGPAELATVTKKIDLRALKKDLASPRRDLGTENRSGVATENWTAPKNRELGTANQTVNCQL